MIRKGTNISCTLRVLTIRKRPSNGNAIQLENMANIFTYWRLFCRTNFNFSVQIDRTVSDEKKAENSSRAIRYVFLSEILTTRIYYLLPTSTLHRDRREETRQIQGNFPRNGACSFEKRQKFIMIFETRFLCILLLWLNYVINLFNNFIFQRKINKDKSIISSNHPQNTINLNKRDF